MTVTTQQSINSVEEGSKAGKDNKRTNNRKNVDHGWAWVVLGASFLAQMLLTGHTQNSGTFFSIFLEAFGMPRQDTMWIMSIQGATNSLSGALAGTLVYKYGARFTMITGALIYGLSLGLLYFVESLPMAAVCYGFGGIGIPFVLTSIIACDAQYFEKRLYLVMGLVATGAGIGITIIGNEMEYALEMFGWRGTMLIQSAVVLHICVCGSLIFNNKIEEKSVNSTQDAREGEATVVEDESTSKPSLLSYWVDTRFVLQTLGYATFTAGRDITQYILKDLYTSLQVDYSYQYVITFFGVATSVGRLMSGFISMNASPPLCNIIATFLCAGSIFLLIMSHSGIYLLVGIAFYGFFTGQQVVYQKQSWGAIFNKEIMATLYGYSYIFTVIPRFGVPPVAGYIKDTTGSYAAVIILATFFMLLSAFSYVAAYIIHKRNTLKTTT